MGAMQSTKEFLLKHIEKALFLLYPLLFVIFQSYFWHELPAQLAQSCEALLLSRAIVLLCWLLLFFLGTTFYFLYKNYSKNRVKKILRKRFNKQLNFLSQIEDAKKDALRYWINNTEPLFNKYSEYKNAFISNESKLLAQDSQYSQYQKVGRQGIIDAMEKTIASLDFELEIS